MAKVDIEVSPSIINLIKSRVPCLHVSDEPKLVSGVRKTSWFLFHLHGWHQFVSNSIYTISFILKIDYTSITSPIQIAFESLHNLTPSCSLTYFSGHLILVRRISLLFHGYVILPPVTVDLFMTLWLLSLTHTQSFPSLKPDENECLMSWAWMANHYLLYIS